MLITHQLSSVKKAFPSHKKAQHINRLRTNNVDKVISRHVDTVCSPFTFNRAKYMSITRREFIQAISLGLSLYATRISAGNLSKNSLIQNILHGSEIPNNYYDIKPFGNVPLLHFTDCHAQLLPGYYREPSMHIGVGKWADSMPYIVGEHLLKKMNFQQGSTVAHAFSSTNFEMLAEKFGKMGGFAEMTSLIKTLKSNRPGALLLDGGDTWQGSATSLWTDGQDMIDAALKLGVDVMTGHWEFTYGMERVKHVIENDFAGKIDFVAQNVLDLEFEDPVFEPYTMKEINGVKVAVIGQAFPFTPIANPRYMVKDWQFGLREDRLQEMIDECKEKGAQVITLLSHNGLNLDMKLATRVIGLDVIFSGHTHDALPFAYEAKNAGGRTLVVNSGSGGKFVALLELDVKKGKPIDFQFNMIPVFANAITPDKDMADYIKSVRKPYEEKLNEKLAVSHDLLYRRGTFNGSFDQLICDAIMNYHDTEIAFSPGFRWGMSVLPGQPITLDDVMDQTAITYPVVTKSTLSGQHIKNILEDVGDNRFNPDPYYQQGGDMVRVGGLQYSINIGNPGGKRIGDMTLNGKPIDPNKKYTVAGWAGVRQLEEGPAIYDVVADYLRDKKTVEISNVNIPKIKNNPGKYGIG